MTRRVSEVVGESRRIRVGVTGHRRLADEPLLAARVGEALARLRAGAGGSTDDLAFTIVSPLAEGADRLVARRVLEEPGARLEALLPLPIQDYQRDFETAASRQEFIDLLERAELVEVIEPARSSGVAPAPDGAASQAGSQADPSWTSRESAYLAVGQVVLQRCDVLIAIWDGQPARGRGGTAEIVELARSRGLPLIWIEAAPPARLHTERLEPLQARHLEG